MRVDIDQRGRITIPKAVRDAFGLLPGSTVEFSETETGNRTTVATSETRPIGSEGPFLVALGRGRTVTDKEIRDLRLADQR